MLDSRYLLIGAVSAGVTALSIAVVLAGTRLSRPEYNFISVEPILWFQRAFSFAIFFAIHIVLATDPNSFVIAVGAKESGVWIKVGILFATTYSGVVVFLEAFAILRAFSRSSHIYRIGSRACVVLLPLALLSTVALWSRLPLLSDLVKFAGLIWLGVVAGMLGIADRRYGGPPKYLGEGEEESSERGFAQYVGIVGITFAAFAFAQGYARYIYPNVPMSLGGGKPVPALVFTETDVVEGNVVNVGPTWIQIMSTGGKSVQLRKDSVRQIRWHPKLNNANTEAVRIE